MHSSLFGDQHKSFFILSYTGATRISTDVLVESLLEQDNDDNTNANTSATVQQSELDTDGKHRFSVETLTVPPPLPRACTILSVLAKALRMA